MTCGYHCQCLHRETERNFLLRHGLVSQESTPKEVDRTLRQTLRKMDDATVAAMKILEEGLSRISPSLTVGLALDAKIPCSEDASLTVSIENE